MSETTTTKVYRTKDKTVRLRFIKTHHQDYLDNFSNINDEVNDEDVLDASEKVKKLGLSFYSYKHIGTFENFIFSFCKCKEGLRCIIAIKTDNLKINKNNYIDILFNIIKDFEDYFIKFKDIRYRIVDNRSFLDIII